MTDSTNAAHRAKRSRLAPLAWISGLVAATLLVLGVSGTLSDWSTAIINNDTNTVAVKNAVILQETGPSPANTVCNSTDGAQTTVNAYTCSTINKYGGTTTPLTPGGSQVVSVTMKNTGTEPGALTLGAGSCATISGGLTGAPSVCTQLQVKVECPAGTNTYPTTATTASLTQFNTDTGTTPASVATLAAGSSVICRFTVSLPVTTAPNYSGQTVKQALTWTLTGA